MERYSIGVDFGSTGAQLAIVAISSGAIVGTCKIKYEHSNVAIQLSNANEKAELHNPIDYLDALYKGIPQIIKESGVSPSKIIAIGIDATTSSPMPTNKFGKPLCLYSEFSDNQNSYIKTWKDHTAEREAILLNDIIRKNGELVTALSPEWILPKALHIFLNDKKLFEAMDKYIEVGDWVVWQLTGIESRNTVSASLTYLCDKNRQFLYEKSLKNLSGEFSDFFINQFNTNMHKPTQAVGYITDEMAHRLNLHNRVIVAASNIDAVATIPSSGIIGPGRMLSILGTSACHLTLTSAGNNVPGSHKIEGGLFDDLYTYILSQVAFGDCFQWFIRNMVPYSYYMESKSRNIDIPELLGIKTKSIDPNKIEILAVDLFNGFRDKVGYYGTLTGLSIYTKPEEIFLAIIESTAFGLRYIVEAYEQAGVPINQIVVCGGVLEHFEYVLQILANIVQKPFKRISSLQATAVGSAITAAVAAKSKNGGYDDLRTAMNRMSHTEEKEYSPYKKYEALYQKKYMDYLSLMHYVTSEF